MNDGKNEDMSSPEEALEIDGNFDVCAAHGAGAVPDAVADEHVLEDAATSSPDPQTAGSEKASEGVPCPAVSIGVDAPISENEGDPLGATEVDDVSMEVPSDAEGAADPTIQLPAVVHGGPIAMYSTPAPYKPHAAFLLDVQRSLPPNFELDEQTGRIFTSSTSLRRLPLCGPLRVSAREDTWIPAARVVLGRSAWHGRPWYIDAWYSWPAEPWFSPRAPRATSDHRTECRALGDLPIT